MVGILKKGAKLTLKQLQKLKKQAEKDVIKEEEIAYKKFDPDTQGAEMDDLAVARMELNGIEDEILKRTTSKSDLKKMGKDHLLKKSGRRIGSIRMPKKTKKLKVDQEPNKKKEPIDPRDLAKNLIEAGELPKGLPRKQGFKKKSGGKLRGMGVALRGGGKVMRG